MKKILITGATSFIGSYLLTELQKQKNIEIYALVRPDSPNIKKLKNAGDIIVVPLDFNNVVDIHKYIKRVDLCYHLAWNGTRGDSRYDAKLQESNFENSVRLYSAVKSLGCKVFIGIGSQAEYGICNELITEDTPTVPNTAYGKWKLATGRELMELGQKEGMRVVWGRVFSIYGKGDYENTLIMSAIRKMKNNEPIDMTEGTQYWNYLYVVDLAKILVVLMNNKNASGIYNLASNDTKLLREYILDLKKYLHSNCNINFGVIPYRNEGKVNIQPSIDKLLEIIGHDFVFSKFTKNIKLIE